MDDAKNAMYDKQSGDVENQGPKQAARSPTRRCTQQEQEAAERFNVLRDQQKCSEQATGIEKLRGFTEVFFHVFFLFKGLEMGHIVQSFIGFVLLEVVINMLGWGTVILLFSYTRWDGS